MTRPMKILGLWLVLMCAMSWPISGQEVAAGDIATTIRALEAEWAEAQAHQDNRALNLIFDNDLVYIEYGRLVTKGDYLSRVRLPQPDPSQVVMESLTVRAFGSTAIVVGAYRETGTKNGKRWLKRWRFLDTWVYTTGRWMLVGAAATPAAK
jgi:ketosteroid isomerase-like protein